MTNEGGFDVSKLRISFPAKKIKENAQYTFKDVNTVDFGSKVFTAANVITFENVKILSDRQGDQTIKAALTDFVGNEIAQAFESVAIVYDNEKPVINSITWMPDNDDQVLHP